MNTAWITNNPFGCVAACAVWIFLAIWIMATIQWMIMGEIEVIHGVISLMVGFTLGYFTSNPPLPWIGHILFFVIIVTMIGFPFVRQLAQGRLMVSIDVDQMEQSYELLSGRPNNPTVHFRMARILFEQGQAAHAIALAQEALKTMPKQHFHHEHAELRMWMQRNPDPAITSQMVGCKRCPQRVPVGTLTCPRCKARVLLDAIGGMKASPSGAIKRIVGVWIAVVALIILIPVASTGLPMLAAIPLILTGTGLGCYLVFRVLASETSS
jgi:hypothetical protein